MLIEHTRPFTQPVYIHSRGRRTCRMAIPTPQQLSEQSNAPATLIVVLVKLGRGLAQVSAASSYKPAFVDVDKSKKRFAATSGYRWQADPAWHADAPATSLAEAGVRSTVAARWGDLAKAERWAEEDNDDDAVGCSKAKKRTAKAAKAAAAGGGSDVDAPSFRTEEQRTLFGLLSSYRDVLYTARALPGGEARAGAAQLPPSQRPLPRDDVMDAYLLHALQVQSVTPMILTPSPALRKTPRRCVRVLHTPFSPHATLGL